MALFYGSGSTASRLGPLRGGSLVFTMEMNWKNMQASLQIQISYRNSCSQVMELLFDRFCKNLRKVSAVQSYFSTVTGLAILLKQDPTTGVFVKTFRNFQNRYFLCSTSRWLLQNLQTALIVPTPSVLPYLYVGTRDGGGLAISGF